MKLYRVLSLSAPMDRREKKKREKEVDVSTKWWFSIISIVVMVILIGGGVGCGGVGSCCRENPCGSDAIDFLNRFLLHDNSIVQFLVD